MTNLKSMAAWTTLVALLGGISLAATNATVPPAADLILNNGAIHTPSGWVKALAVRQGVIVALGDEAAMAALKGARTQVIDLAGATVVPGLHDMHVHPLFAGLEQQRCRIAQGSSAQQILDAVKICAAQHAKGEWVTGGQWEASAFARRPMHRALLDQVAPDHPVALGDIAGHSLWVNTQALQLAGITDRTADPAGGVIERDAKGEPTGVLRESAVDLVQKHIPAPTHAENVAALRWSMHTMLSFGITSYADAIVDDASMRAYDTLADQGVLKQRVRGCMVWSPENLAAYDGKLPDYIVMHNLYARERFRPDCIKMFLDGVPTDSHTAAMLEPYADLKTPDDPRARGLLMVPPKVLNAALTDLDRRGYLVKMHAAGDWAVREGLDAIEAARKANGFSGILHSVDHNSFVHLSDIARARSLGATFNMSPYIWYMQPIVPDNAKSAGPERMKRWIPVKDAIDAGALVTAGSDWSVVASVSPWIALETLVTRQPPGGGGEPLGAAERITLQQAFDLYTVNGARQMGNAGRTGRIERGMLADLAVLDRNPFGIAITDVHNVKVRMTLINGEIVYRSDAPG